MKSGIIYSSIIIGAIFSVFVAALFGVVSIAMAQNATVLELQDKINTSNTKLSAIEEEIAAFESALQEVGAEKNTLQRAINQLELERKKVLSEIGYTENKIEATDFELDKLVLEIDSTEKRIVLTEYAIGETIRTLHMQNNEALIEALLRHDTISEFWSSVESLEMVRQVIFEHTQELERNHHVLEAKVEAGNSRRRELESLKSQYDDQKQVLENNKSEKDTLLDQTESEEESYQSLLTSKRAAREEILKAIRDFESELQFTLDPNSIPQEGTAVFNWPVASPIITQLFGGTEFAKRNPGVYGGRPYHTGVDFGAPRGTKIYAPAAGTVRAMDNTDAYAGCLSLGKWSLIDHDNGLSTLYAHQDLIAVTPGQRVASGDVIGYVGNTGYSTGPHLHFGLYVTDAVSIKQFRDFKTYTSCGSATTPVAAANGRLDPSLYLPQ